MQIMVNGTPLEVAVGLTLRDVLAELGAQPEHVAVEHNGEVVEPGELGKRVLKASDRLEIVRFVGGG